MTDTVARAPAVKHVLGEPSVEGLARWIQECDVRRILVLVGAGASVAAGIPDFRSPNTGIYANLGKYNLDDPTDAFSLPLLREKPEVFYTIAKEMNLWPGQFRPTPVHWFIRLLQDEGRLLRCCTQNIDGLEKAAGISPKLLVEAHGSFATASCIECHTAFDIAQNHREAIAGHISHCAVCGGIVKPSVVFFGESLPDAFFDALHRDAPVAELVLIIGTSLQVHPFASLPLFVPQAIPRVVINMERVGGYMFRFPDDPPCLLREGSHTSSSSSLSPEQQQQSQARGAQPSPASPPPDRKAAMDMPKETELLETAPADNKEWRSASAASSSSSSTSSSSDGYAQYGDYDAHPEVCRDVLFRGDCQANIVRLVACLGCTEAFEKLQHAAPEA